MDEQEDIFQADLFVDRSYTSKEISIAEISISLLALHHSSSTDFDLTGQIIWPASHLLALYLYKQRDDLGKKRILELGSGVGLGGMVAARLVSQPDNVILTDHQEDVLKILQDNININFSHEEASPVCARLAWGEDVEEFKETYGTFDLICGADVVFWPSAVPLLFQTAAQLLKPEPTSQLIISYICRSEFSSQLMYQSAAEAGFTWVKAEIESDPLFTDLIDHQLSVGRSSQILIFTRK